MIKTLHIKQKKFQRKFTIVWVISTFFFLISLLFFQWQCAHWKKNQQFRQEATNLAFEFDKFIGKLIAQTHRLPLDNVATISCKNVLLPYLQTIIFNNFNIAGIMVGDKTTNFHCLAVKNNFSLSVAKYNNPILINGLDFSQSNNIFLLQKKMSHYYVMIYIKRDVLDLLIQNNNLQFNFVGLYDINQEQMIFHFGQVPIGGNWLPIFKSIQPLFNPVNDDNHTRDKIILPLHNLPDINIIIHQTPLTFDSYLLLNLLFLSLPFILLSWLIYKYLIILMTHRYSLKYAIKMAVINNQFFPSYQPIRNDCNQRYEGVEVLIRWHSELDGIIMPDYFISEAEKSDLIIPMTLQLVKKTFDECQLLLHKKPYFYVSFNLSLGHFKNDIFFKEFYLLCEQYRIAANQIMLEITEREVFDQDELNIVDRLNELRHYGYSLALDDFGTGHASISYLHHFPFNYLKIDQLFIQAIGTGAITETLNLAIINMANSLNLTIIAEGVETQEQLDYLRQYNVKFIQGWYFCKAIDYATLATLMLD